METFKIKWRSNIVGELIDPTPDMWYLEGKWKSNHSDMAEDFVTLLCSFDSGELFRSPEKGILIEVTEKGDPKPFQCLALSLDGMVVGE